MADCLVPVPFLRELNAILAVPGEKSIVNEASRYYPRPIMAERKENNSVPFYKRCGWKLFGSDCDEKDSTSFDAAVVAIRNHISSGRPRALGFIQDA